MLGTNIFEWKATRGFKQFFYEQVKLKPGTLGTTIQFFCLTVFVGSGSEPKLQK